MDDEGACLFLRLLFLMQVAPVRHTVCILSRVVRSWSLCSSDLAGWVPQVVLSPTTSSMLLGVVSLYKFCSGGDRSGEGGGDRNAHPSQGPCRHGAGEDAASHQAGYDQWSVSAAWFAGLCPSPTLFGDLWPCSPRSALKRSAFTDFLEFLTTPARLLCSGAGGTRVREQNE
jgi:hypothetical protein